jgi:phage terminase small subunit
MVASYDGWDDPASLALLTAAAEQLQRAEAARKTISVDGVTILDRFGRPKEHPACVTERAAVNLFRLLIREMGLDTEAAEPARLPRIAGRYAV